MVRCVWTVVCVLQLVTANNKNEVEKGTEKEARFLPLFEVKRYHPAARPPPHQPGPPPPHFAPSASGGYGNARCSERLESALEQLKKRKRTHAKRESEDDRSLDLPGYSVFKEMRSAPIDMYVTRMRVRLPQNTEWVRVEKCFFDPRNATLDTKLLFHDLTISGNVDLYDSGLNRRALSRRHIQDFDDPYRGGGYNSNSGGCNMILRIRKAGIGFHTRPLHHSPGKFNVKTDSEFVEPGFISVYAYGCERYLHRKSRDSPPPLSRKKRSLMDEFSFDSHLEESGLDGRSDQWDTYDVLDNNRVNYERSKLFRPDDQLDEAEEISREMEDIFTKGIRTLLTTYMKKELQPAIKETLIRNLGYVISYG